MAAVEQTIGDIRFAAAPDILEDLHEMFGCDIITLEEFNTDHEIHDILRTSFQDELTDTQMRRAKEVWDERIARLQDARAHPDATKETVTNAKQNPPVTDYEACKEDKRRLEAFGAAILKEKELRDADRAEILADLLPRLKEDPGLVYSDQTIFAALKAMHCDADKAAEWEQAKLILKKAGIGLKKIIKKFHEGEEENQPLEMPFVESPDGTLAEMVMQDGEPFFAVYNPKTDKVEYFEELTLNGEKIVPPFNDEILPGAMNR